MAILNEEPTATEEIFRRLTNKAGYAVVDIQLAKDATDSDIRAISTLRLNRYGMR